MRIGILAQTFSDAPQRSIHFLKSAWGTAASLDGFNTIQVHSGISFPESSFLLNYYYFNDGGGSGGESVVVGQ